MNDIFISKGSALASVVPARGGGARDWQRWSPYAAVAWSLIYAALGVYWTVSGRGFPYTFGSESGVMEPLLARSGPGAAWIVVMMAGIPAVVLGAAMLRGVGGRVLRLILIAAGGLLAGVLLVFMTSLDLLIKLGYAPYFLVGLISGAEVNVYLEGYARWTTVHQLWCLFGGFLWLAATVSYARRSGGACVYCGRRDSAEGWTSPDMAARWGRLAVYVAMVAPVFYAVTRYAWALGIPLGMSEEQFWAGLEGGKWLLGALFLGNFCLVGAVLMLGLVQRWGEEFPRWMIGIAGRRVPIALAVVPAWLAAALLVVGGIGIWSSLGQLVAGSAAGGAEGMGLVGEIIFQLGPTLLFPLWGVALGIAALGYYYRRRGPCSVCGRGTSAEVGVEHIPITKKRPLFSYLALTFLISWGGILLVVGRSGFTVSGEEAERQVVLMYLAMLAGPSIAGIVMTRAVYGRPGWRDLGSRLLSWRVGARWYAVALLIAPLVITLILLVLSRISPMYLPRIYLSDEKGVLLQFSFTAGMIVGFFEELGWTGFAVHTMLKQRRDILSTGLIVGLFFGAWHLLVVFLIDGTTSGSGELSLAIFLPATLFTWLPTYRVLMVWVYDRTGSLLLPMLMYASLTAFWTLLTPLAISGGTLVIYYLIFSAVVWVIIFVALRRHTLPRLQHA